ncbi:hypothetical protein EIP91_004325 [Steccherinum ochraceum]|uniref:CENP-C homolog n=1 Tax=Steccherinum ochraceum TaxID=92696 RepID=A0A4R0RBI4_9APHY|nr:hypothetical protein EIP91_004325 [Steccherinum ochraceum]
MPTSVRKSSVGANRRGPQPYIPYRGDDFQRGKRTGIAVAVVEHNSDDFEPFEEVLKQADARTPPRPKIQNRKKRGPKTPVVEEPEYDENGEMSMDLVDSPAAYFSNARVPSITSSVQRVGSSSRPVHRSSDIDFDDIPSPRRTMSALSHGRRSLGLGLSPARSRLSTATNPQDLADGLEVDDNFDVGDFNPPDPDDDSDNEPLLSPSPSAAPARRRSFQQMDEEEEEEEEQVEEEVNAKTPTSAKAKGKQRQVEPEPEDDQDMPDAFEGGFDDGDMDPPEMEDMPQQDEEEEEDREETPKPKKVRGKRNERDENAEEEERPKPKRKRRDGILREVIQDNNQEHPNGVRRGTRTRYAPLDWWRLEKVVYGRRESGPCLVPNIKEIHRVPKEEVVPLGSKRRKRMKSRGKSATRSVEPEEIVPYNPEEGWDDDTPDRGMVIDYETELEQDKRVAFTAKMLELKPAANHEFLFQKVFGDGNFIAAGQLTIPPKKQKPTKGTKDNTFVFYVIEGAVNFKVHRTSFVLTTGAMFLVPRGNMYYIQNISDREAKLFFAQARKMPEYELADERGSSSRSPSKERRSESVKRTATEVNGTDKAAKAKKKVASQA